MITVRTDVGLVFSSLKILAADLAGLDDRLALAAQIVYEATRERFDAQGFGEWPDLTESTVARKTSLGIADPERILYETGDLFESATSPNGPYSQLTRTPGAIHLIVDWQSGDWQIGSVLAMGDDSGTLPARPIWPDPDDKDLQRKIAGALTSTWIVTPEVE